MIASNLNPGVNLTRAQLDQAYIRSGYIDGLCAVRHVYLGQNRKGSYEYLILVHDEHCEEGDWILTYFYISLNRDGEFVGDFPGCPIDCFAEHSEAMIHFDKEVSISNARRPAPMATWERYPLPTMVCILVILLCLPIMVNSSPDTLERKLSILGVLSGSLGLGACLKYLLP